MNSELPWVLVSLGIQVQPQIILDPAYLPDYLSVSYDYASREEEIFSEHESDIGNKTPTSGHENF